MSQRVKTEHTSDVNTIELVFIETLLKGAVYLPPPPQRKAQRAVVYSYHAFSKRTRGLGA